jgi:hypothetical protein
MPSSLLSSTAYNAADNMATETAATNNERTFMGGSFLLGGVKEGDADIIRAAILKSQQHSDKKSNKT